MADGMNAVGAATSPARPPDPGYRLRRAQAPAAPPQGRTRRQQTSCPAEDRRARCRVEGNGHLTIRIVQPGALVTRTQPVGRWPVHRTGVRHRASPAAARAGRPHADAARSDPASTPATSLASPQPHAITIPSASPATPDPTRRPRRRGPVRLVTNPAPPAARFLPGCGHGLRRHRYSPARLQAYAAHKGPDRRRGQRANVPPPRF